MKFFCKNIKIIRLNLGARLRTTSNRENPIMAKKIDGCVHLIFKNNKCVNVFTHLNILPKDGVIHLKGDKIFTYKEFKKTHPRDHDELKQKKQKIIISQY